MKGTNKLRTLIDEPGIKVLPGIYDCVGARIVEQLGFQMVFTSGYCISASALGMPDYGLLTATEMISNVRRIAQSVSIPVVADCDTGYGNALNVMRTVGEIVQNGIAGIILEDQQWPKRCGHMKGKSVISKDAHVEKIRAAVEARGDSGLVIIARTDARAINGLDDAISRGEAYHQAGADVVFIEAPQSREELQTISKSLPGVRLFANMIEGGKTPLMSAAELEELGYSLVVFPLSGIFTAAAAMRACFSHLKEHGTTEGLNAPRLDFTGFEEITELEKYQKLEAEFQIHDK